MEKKEFEYNGTVVQFEINDKNVMVNASQMANVFGKEPAHFIRNENTKNLIEAFCQTANSQFENEFSPSGKFVKVVKGGRESGTWMDRRVAIAFAMWLNPFFAVWVCNTIDYLLFGSYIEDEQNLKEIAYIQKQIEQKEQYLASLPEQQELDSLRKEEAHKRKLIEQRKKHKINGFKTLFSEESMNGEEKA
ncbi:KilA-N domain-containing protein [Parabacteroides sp. W1-Q-101]|uniref:KilA-N domain-containing protein n=1 Tax=Parabacteroides caeci TaxID=2949650 RepID=UPI00202FA3C5|nr:KilA-N domain-containing protein [Parabacteroides sp. W1-Q-101]MCM0717328.1 KilA-N domain-containing protein [Parabacteroides sp. W1-Q-101]